MRQYLETNKELKLQLIDCSEIKSFHLKNVIGIGGGSIVYDAYTKESFGKKYFRIKECFPLKGSAKREGDNVIWESKAEKEAVLRDFFETQKLLGNLQSNEDTGNNVVKLSNVYRGNGTLYSVMERTYGTVYSEDKEDDLKKIIEIMIVLSKVVKRYHDSGFVHLDLKPENFMVCYEPNAWIWLFDFDTVTKIADLHNRKVNVVPYSPGWESPEQRLGIVSKVGKCTDVYAIGSILFYKIMGRKVESKDLSIFADWNFDCPILKNINPKVVRLIRGIFQNTLSANVKRRYQDVGDLIEALEAVRQLLYAGTPYLRSEEKVVSTKFFGRQKELDEIRKRFEEGKRAVFLYGDGGIGKSTIAIKYGEQFRKEYDVIIFMRYNDSLETLVDKELVKCLKNCDSEDQIEKRNIIKGLMDDRTLLIVDNFDVEIDRDDFLDDFLEYNAHILFTTRTNFGELYDGDISQIAINALSNYDLKSLFEATSGYKLMECDYDSFEKLTLAVDGNTFAVELFARQIAATGCTLNFITDKLQSGLYAVSNTGKVKYQKDGKLRKEKVYDAIKKLFDLSNLNDEQKQILRNLYMLRFIKVDRTQYMLYTWCDSDQMDAINDLVETGWIKSECNKWFSLHPLIEELVYRELNPNADNCKNVYFTIESKIADCINYSSGLEVDEYKIENDIDLICNFFAFNDMNDATNLNLVLNWLVGMVDNDDIYIDSPDSWRFSSIYDKLEVAARRGQVDIEDLCKIYYVLFFVWFNEFGRVSFTVDFERIEIDYEKMENEIAKNYRSLIRVIDQCCPEMRAFWDAKVGAFVEGMLESPSYQDISVTFAEELYERYKDMISLTPHTKEKYQLPLTNEELEALNLERRKKHDEKEEWEIEEEWKQVYINSFRNTSDKITYVQELISNNTMSEFERSSILSACMTNIFQSIQLGYASKKEMSNHDWDSINCILEIEDEFLWSYECSNDNDKRDWIEFVEENEINQIITCAVLEDVEGFEILMDSFMQSLYDKSLCDLNSKRYSWFSYMHMFMIHNIRLKLIVNAVQRIKKTSYLLPYLIDYSENLKKFAMSLDDFDEKLMFSLYKLIVELAEEAGCEKDVAECYRKNYSKIEWKYRDLMDELADVDYILK